MKKSEIKLVQSARIDQALEMYKEHPDWFSEIKKRIVSMVKEGHFPLNLELRLEYEEALKPFGVANIITDEINKDIPTFDFDELILAWRKRVKKEEVVIEIKKRFCRMTSLKEMKIGSYIDEFLKEFNNDILDVIIKSKLEDLGLMKTLFYKNVFTEDQRRIFSENLHKRFEKTEGNWLLLWIHYFPKHFASKAITKLNDYLRSLKVLELNEEFLICNNDNLDFKDLKNSGTTKETYKELLLLWAEKEMRCIRRDDLAKILFGEIEVCLEIRSIAKKCFPITDNNMSLN